MDYIFILGRNVKLSVAEVLSYFEKEGILITNYFLRENAMFVNINERIGEIVNDFGGVISMGEVMFSGDLKKIISDLEKKEIYLGKGNKFNYVIWNFCQEEAENVISEYLKERFRKERLKATRKPLRGSLKLQGKNFVGNVSSNKSVDEEYFLFEKEGNYFFGKIVQKCNYEEIEKRDMEKPVRREELAISPRLSKIMINLAGLKRGGILVDPFCGIGVVLKEALLQDIQVVGIDKDKNAIEGAEVNLSHAGFERENYNLINGDSRKVSIKDGDAIVTEPSLGKVLRKIPTENEAKRITEDFERLIIAVINNLKNNVSGIIVFTAPFIKTHKGRVSCNSEKIIRKTGLKTKKFDNIEFPLKEFRDGQIVGREIFVLER
jgi:tRNA G10  N-methylase Trm11